MDISKFEGMTPAPLNQKMIEIDELLAHYRNTPEGMQKDNAVEKIITFICPDRMSVLDKIKLVDLEKYHAKLIKKLNFDLLERKHIVSWESVTLSIEQLNILYILTCFGSGYHSYNTQLRESEELSRYHACGLANFVISVEFECLAEKYRGNLELYDKIPKDKKILASLRQDLCVLAYIFPEYRIKLIELVEFHEGNKINDFHIQELYEDVNVKN